jgi:hypothetical protein
VGDIVWLCLTGVRWWCDDGWCCADPWALFVGVWFGRVQGRPVVLCWGVVVLVVLMYF